MFHTVYLSFENGKEGRDYVGKHSTEDPYDGYLGSFRDDSFSPDGKIVIAYAKTPQGAVWLEERFQKVFRVVEDPQFANQAYQTSTGFDRTGAIDSEKTKRKKSLAQKGNKKGLGNKSKTGQTNSQSHREAVSRANRGNAWASKPIILVHPNGVEEVWESVSKACRKYNLDPGHLSACARGERKRHRKFTARFVRGKTN
jgi:hypothetical protein